MPAVSNRAEIKAIIVNKLGLHARPAMTFVDLASTFGCDVKVSKGDTEVDGKSIMQMMMLAAGKGSEILIICEGDDAEKAAAALKALVDAGFDEE
ncbi:MAG: HPr family phosphocarrier protein [Planctomycetes bacterium]|nr:HPr family phosphocarrier protein [Planctomycetota bacterium]